MIATPRQGTLWQAIGLVLLVVLLVAVGVRTVGPLTRLVGNAAAFGEYLHSFGAWGSLVFVLIQALQVIIAPIPGELTQLAGGLVYGTWWGTFYSSVGILAGSAVVFVLGRWLGYPLLKRVVPEKALAKFDFIVNHPRTELVILLLFLIPGSPKDTLTYMSGLTPVKPVRFLVTAMVARFPGILLSSFIGAHVEEKRYGAVVAASGVALVLFVAGVLLQDRVMARLKSRSTPAPDAGKSGGTPPRGL